jgi:hypothetical protein
MDYTNDELEEQGLVECCAHCGSLHITIEKEGKYCNDCGVLNYTKLEKEKDYVNGQNINY